jgi:hypothetical protein
MVRQFNPGSLKHGVPSGGHIVAYALTDAGMLNMFSSFTKCVAHLHTPRIYPIHVLYYELCLADRLLIFFTSVSEWEWRRRNAQLGAPWNHLDQGTITKVSAPYFGVKGKLNLTIVSTFYYILSHKNMFHLQTRQIGTFTNLQPFKHTKVIPR